VARKRRTDRRVLIGLACGEAADGAEAALVEVRGRAERMKPRQLASLHRAFPPELCRRLRAIRAGKGVPPGEAARLERDVGVELASLVEEAKNIARRAGEEVLAAGLLGLRISEACLAGQVGAVVELGSAAIAAGRSTLPVVSGFAASDAGAGGLGGPVTAWVDWLLFRDKRLSRVSLHLGGIATLSFIPTDAAACDVVAFDVGPGTILTDAFAEKYFGRPCDIDGGLAAKGRPSEAMLNELLAEEYFHRQPPKRTGAERWGGAMLERIGLIARKHRCRGEDLLATVTELTARSVALAVEGLTERPHQVILTGGGAKNIHLAGRIRALLCPSSTVTSEKFEIDSRAKRAVCAAVLAAARLDGFPAHCPWATGATRPTVLGAVWQP